MEGIATSHQVRVCLYHLSKINAPMSGINKQIQIDIIYFLKYTVTRQKKPDRNLAFFRFYYYLEYFNLVVLASLNHLVSSV